MSRLNLRGVTVDEMKKMALNGDGKMEYIIKMSAAYNDEVAKQLGWVPEGFETYPPPLRLVKGGFNNVLSADKMSITPNKKELQEGLSLLIDLLQVGKFSYHHEVEGDMPMNRRISFEVKSIEEDLHIPIATFIKAMNTGGLTSVAWVNYSDPIKNPADDPQMKLTADAQDKKFGSEVQ